MNEPCNEVDSVEELLDELADAIACDGFVVISVADDPPWTHTIGLLDSADHPELIVAGAPLARAERLLDSMAKKALRGEHYHAGDTIDLGESLVARVGMVHPIHFELDAFALWQTLADLGAIHRHHPRAVQVLMPPECRDGTRLPQPLLANPNARVGSSPSTNRAQRRARERRRRN